jgi:rhodanese-related sulfurtransferase
MDAKARFMFMEKEIYMSAVVAQVVNRAGVRAFEPADELSGIIIKAENRARERGLAYRGQLTPEEAWTLVQNYPLAKLVDVRSSEELSLIGRVPGALGIQWKLYPDWRRNPQFLTEVKQHLVPEDFILLLCRSGVRSREAAEFLAREGFLNAFNVLEGFEGDKNAASQRIVAGWKARGLPWTH